MKILVDADACPVKEIIISIAKEYNIPVIMFIDTSHILEDDYAKIVTVEKGKNSVDIVLANNCLENDIVVTQDFGVAAMALAKKCFALNQNGLIFTNNNMDRLLFERHMRQKARRSGKKAGGNPHKRIEKDDDKFRNALLSIITQIKTL